MDLPSYLENIEHSIKNIKFGPISNQTTFLATQKSNISQIILLKSDSISKKSYLLFKNIDLCF